MIVQVDKLQMAVHDISPDLFVLAQIPKNCPAQLSIDAARNEFLATITELVTLAKTVQIEPPSIPEVTAQNFAQSIQSKVDNYVWLIRNAPGEGCKLASLILLATFNQAVKFFGDEKIQRMSKGYFSRFILLSQELLDKDASPEISLKFERDHQRINEMIQSVAQLGLENKPREFSPVLLTSSDSDQNLSPTGASPVDQMIHEILVQRHKTKKSSNPLSLDTKPKSGISSKKNTIDENDSSGKQSDPNRSSPKSPLKASCDSPGQLPEKAAHDKDKVHRAKSAMRREKTKNHDDDHHDRLNSPGSRRRPSEDVPGEYKPSPSKERRHRPSTEDGADRVDKQSSRSGISTPSKSSRGIKNSSGDGSEKRPLAADSGKRELLKSQDDLPPQQPSPPTSEKIARVVKISDDDANTKLVSPGSGRLKKSLDDEKEKLLDRPTRAIVQKLETTSDDKSKLQPSDKGSRRNRQTLTSESEPRDRSPTGGTGERSPGGSLKFHRDTNFESSTKPDRLIESQSSPLLTRPKTENLSDKKSDKKNLKSSKPEEDKKAKDPMSPRKKTNQEEIADFLHTTDSRAPQPGNPIVVPQVTIQEQKPVDKSPRKAGLKRNYTETIEEFLADLETNPPTAPPPQTTTSEPDTRLTSSSDSFPVIPKLTAIPLQSNAPTEEPPKPAAVATSNSVPKLGFRSSLGTETRLASAANVISVIKTYFPEAYKNLTEEEQASLKKDIEGACGSFTKRFIKRNFIKSKRSPYIISSSKTKIRFNFLTSKGEWQYGEGEVIYRNRK